jgi:thiol-disulfide isomerase/thioredoxin
MRNLLFLIMLAGIFACTRAPSSSVLLSGTLEGHEDTRLEFTYLNEFINNDRVVLDIEPDEEGSFALAFDFDEDVFGTIRAGRTNIPVFLEPGYQVRLEGNASDLFETIRFSGRGGQANNFLMDFQRELEPRLGERFMAEQIRMLDPVTFFMLVDSVALQKFAFLDSWEAADDLSPVFVHFMESQILYDKYQKLIEYPMMQQRLAQLGELPVMPEGYFDFLGKDGLFDDSRLNSPVYVQFLMSYISYYQHHVGATMSDDMSLNQFNYNLAGEALPGASGEYIQAVYLSREFNNGDLETAEKMYREFMENSKNESFKQAVTDTRDAINRLNPGNPAPEFTMTDINGQEVSLSDFRGKVVYLDFWASWCGPCMREMPYFRELKERLADQEDLVYLYISIDTDVQAWRNSVERNQITGVHLNTPGRERGVPALYNVKWIPTFIIIGRDGNIYDNRPPKPSDPEIDQVLLEALAQGA